MNWFCKLFSAPVSEADKARYAARERELTKVRGEFHNTLQSSEGTTRRLRLMEQTLALKDSYDGTHRF